MRVRGPRVVVAVAALVVMAAGVVGTGTAFADEFTPAPAEGATPAATAPAESVTDPGAFVSPPIGVVNPSSVEVGTQVIVTGQFWPANASIVVSTCGNGGVGGSVVCDRSGSRNSQADANGEFITPYVISRPPKPCPCTVHLTSPQSPAVVDLPVEVAGLPTAPIEDLRTDQRLSASVKASGSGPILWSWFGGSANRTATVTLENTGLDPVTGASLVVTVGKGEDPTQNGVTIALDPIGAGQVVTRDIPITVPAGTFGQVTVKATVVGAATVIDARATTTVYPWGFLVLAWLLLQIPLLGLYKRRSVVFVDEVPQPSEVEWAASSAGFAGGVFDPVAASPPMPPPAGFVPVAAGAPAAVAASAATDWNAVGLAEPGGQTLTYGMAEAPSAPAPTGVDALRALLPPGTDAAAGR